MSPLRRLMVAALALAGALCWGPPAVLAVCLGGGACGMSALPEDDVAPSCCAKTAEQGSSVSTLDPAGACCGCCTTVRVGMGVDGPEARLPSPVPPPAPAPALLLPAFDSPDAFVPPASPAAPRAPPEKVLPLRI